ncbi:MAG: Formate--tetrahydrofolate ligase [candidate division TA06 bacterium 32_111]|nr:MAG: Formate--tetrahydrofolate ligase [candidate division TA06 bacterium 32_111]
MAELKRIEEICEKIGIEKENIIPYGKYIAKVNLKERERREKKGKLILVTAMNPTPYGEGKTTVSIGLSDAINSCGRTSIVSLREPSLGPVFGIKGGATGGGLSKVEPSNEINLHFTGDIHAVTSAHNLLAALLDNVYSRKNISHFQPKDIFFHRVLDMNDRALRKVIIGVGDDSGQIRESKFEITAASEVMAILGLSYDLKELKEKLSKIMVGISFDNKPVFSKDIGAENGMAILLKDAINPNIVQTLNNNPAFIHTGPFANIAHGTCSITSIDLATRLADFTVVEAGFGSDLGAEKFLDIVSRNRYMVPPDFIVIVATLRAIKHHGGVKMKNMGEKNLDAVRIGFSNLEKHIENMKSFNINTVVALNKFSEDNEEELELVERLIREKGCEVFKIDVFNQGYKTAVDLAEYIINSETSKNEVNYVYDFKDSIEEKIKKVAYRIYGAYGIVINKKVKGKIKMVEEWGFSELPICIAKTQYSFSDNEKLLGRPKNFNIEIKDIKVSSGAGFIVVYLGNIMTMPGLPEEPSALKMTINEKGEVKL